MTATATIVTMTVATGATEGIGATVETGVVITAIANGDRPHLR
ncbi:hypothetical protein AGR5A_Cc100131 [Agrobacterium genomosp. 5 str. CFBP 6626]|nr:hypothetical protein AGR5A_Cc100131 [Agrobacterium genomosp. 5 str. CFBP 6626]